MKIRKYIAFLGILLTAGVYSCDSILEGSGECYTHTTVTFSFVYDYNQWFSDRFQEQVEYIHLYIYDADTGEMIQSVERSRTDLGAAQTIRITLPFGNYTAVAWGNCHTDDYAITEPEHLLTMHTSLTRIDRVNRVETNDYGSLFHALSSFTLEEETATVPLSLVKNTNKLDIIVKDYPEFLTSESFDVHIIAKNSRYNYDNSYVSDLYTFHYPDYPEDFRQARDITASFTLLRLLNDDQIQISLSVKNVENRLDWNIQRPLIPYIINSMVMRFDELDPDEYLERFDHFQIYLRVIESDETNQLTLEEWDYIHQPIEVG